MFYFASKEIRQALWEENRAQINIEKGPKNTAWKDKTPKRRNIVSACKNDQNRDK